MKRKIFTLLLSAFITTMGMAQAPNVAVQKAKVDPVIDGVADDVWAAVPANNIAVNFKTDTPTLGDVGKTTWKALWNDDGIFILLTVNDDIWFPSYEAGSNDSWMYDKPEIYFDVNEVKIDGLGAGNNQGHYQVAPAAIDGQIDGTPGVDAGSTFAFKVDGDASYVAEYYIPFSKFTDKDGNALNMFAPIGFDVTIIDRDPDVEGRMRANWVNNGVDAYGGKVEESWNSMDGCGTITLSSWDGPVIKKTAVVPEIDGVLDEAYNTANTYNIAVNFKTETPTLGDVGTTTWKALWDDDGIYLFLTVNDDNWFPSYEGGGDSWMYDKPEIYFDVNAVKIDGLGAGNNQGHYQVAPAAKEGQIDGTPGVDAGTTFAFKVTDDASYTAEYYIPFSKFIDKDGAEIDKAIPMGFDVTIIDRDPDVETRQRANWVNDGINANGGKVEESWNSMDGCGLVAFEGAAEAVLVEKITVAAGTITTDNGTLQMVATILPEDATAKKVSWFVENGTGRASINEDGVLTAMLNGTVTVKAVAKDVDKAEGTAIVTISGQTVTIADINIIKNGNFELGVDGKESWYGQAVIDGWLTQECAIPANDPQIWSTMLGQTSLKIADASTAYIFKFKAFASQDMVAPVLFEDRGAGNNNNKQLTTTSEYWDGGYGKFDVPITTEAKWYTFDVIFSSLVENSNYELNFQVGLNEGTLSVDDFQLYTAADFALVDPDSDAKQIAANSLKVYPNPVGAVAELNVSLTAANSKVAIYNAVGQKLMEKVASGNLVKFNVSSLHKGMYFVRLEDGTSQKFIK